MIAEEEIIRIEQSFKTRCINFNIKFKSKKFYELQCEFFCGVMIALNTTLPRWSICIISNREIIKY
jgi:hypothetical protein